MAYEHYPSPQSVVAAFIELTRYLSGRARSNARELQLRAPSRLDSQAPQAQHSLAAR